MEMEFATDAEAIGRLLRGRPLGASREGRVRSQAMKIVWHDSPDRALQSAGLSLADCRGVWRLERLLPGAGTWLPAQPAPVLAEAPAPDGIPGLPSPLAPLAAFEGRRITIEHLLDGSAVTLTLARGTLRAVTDERPAARLWLRGEAPALGAVIKVLQAEAAIAVPRATLAAEGLALAQASAPAPRRTGVPKLPPGRLTTVEALRHILGHLTDVALACAPAAAGDIEAGIEAVHQMRVAVRRARSALTVFRPALVPGALDPVREALKAIGSRLGPRRDWDVFLTETVPAIRESLPGDERLERMVAAAERQRRECGRALADYLKGPAFQALAIDLAWFVHTLGADAPAGPEAPPLADFANHVLARRHRKLVSAGKTMQDMDIPALHGVRLRAKQVRYAAEMFAALHPGKASERFIRRLGVLQQRLGVLNDGAVAAGLMQQLGGASGRHAYAAGIVAGFLAARSRRIRPRILRAFEKFRRQPAYWA